MMAPYKGLARKPMRQQLRKRKVLKRKPGGRYARPTK